MRSFAKIKSSRKFLNLQYSSGSLQYLLKTYISLHLFKFFTFLSVYFVASCNVTVQSLDIHHTNEIELMKNLNKVNV